MKVVYNILGTYNSGGMERVLSNKANYLAGIGYEVAIVTTDQKGRQPYFELDGRIQQIDLGINYTDDVGKVFFKRIGNYWAKQRKHKKKLSNVLLELRSDIVISMFDHDTTFLYKVKDGSHKVLEIHFSRFKRLQYGKKGLLRLLDVIQSKRETTIVKKYERFVVLTEEDKGYWGDLSNIAVIPNANSFSPQRLAMLDNRQAVAVGRLDRQKGFDRLINAWKRIQMQCPDWELHIYGNGPLEAELKNQISMLGLSNAVFIHPATTDIVNVYLESSVYLMTSRYEGLPMALLEAQSCGLPMISFDCKCGPRDIIENGKNGYLIREGDLDAFSEKAIHVMENEQLRKGLGLQAHSMSLRFSQERVIKYWTNLMENLV